jgi:hypothetical protein
MVSVFQVDVTFAMSLFHQVGDDLLPDAASLVIKQAAMASLLRGTDVMGQVFPRTTCGQHIQDAVDDFAVINPFAATPFWLGQKRLDALPLGIG